MDLQQALENVTENIQRHKTVIGKAESWVFIEMPECARDVLEQVLPTEGDSIPDCITRAKLQEQYLQGYREAIRHLMATQ